MRPLQCGVPQGSVLGPLLFIIFLNGIYFSNILSFFIYADDTNAIVSNSNLNDLIHSVNNELNKICTWFKANKLSLNIDKTSCMIFKILHSNRTYPDLNSCTEGIKLSHTKFLGIIINESLTWSNHTTHVVNIVSKYSGILFRLKQIFPVKLYFPYIMHYFFPIYFTAIWFGLIQTTAILLLFISNKKELSEYVQIHTGLPIHHPYLRIIIL